MGDFEFPRRFAIQGLDALFERRIDWTPPRDRNGNQVTEVAVKLGGRGPGALKIFQKGFTTPVARIFGGSYLPSGDKLFDALYGICARPEKVVERLFAPDRRSAVVASVRRIGTYIDPLIDVSSNRLLVQVSEGLGSERGVRNLVATATDFVGYVLDLAGTDGISWGVPSGGEEGRCPVCAAPLESDLVYCQRCRTPHHWDCWSYLGKCSIFGCGETKVSEARI